MNIEDFLDSFPLNVVEDFRKINFGKVYEEVARTFSQWKLCNYCGKKKKYYFHSLDAYREPMKHIKFCSYGCLRKIMKDGYKVPKILLHESLPKNILALHLRELNWKDFQKLKDIKFKMILEKYIKSEKERKLCNYCQQKSWRIGVKIGKNFLNRISHGEKLVSFQWRQFCSQKCLQNYFSYKEDRKLQQYTKG